ncbi:MAG TPA: tRNA (adenosine(37)-N6)-threonylcarbamoyltransferase complex dimerization subunit type 1 TsaB [Steroidobacteraceae bacterium]|nr:tRNA (adenosine(37)-N6)-threonylcarbamoyltransferase complex dimerization subunit type 1 TsaB [Steroidobacteraceae bacterium]
MRMLALDTATEACSVALGLDGRVLERYVEMERGHGERLLPMIDELLAEAGVTLQSLQAIAFGRGPGGFTGVRLAASVAQGLAFGADLGVVPVSDLAAVAQRALALHPDACRVLAVNDARMREVYWAEFSVDGVVRAQGVEHVSGAASVTLPAVANAAWVAAGRGLAVYPELAQRCRAAGARVEPEVLPRASEVLELAQAAAAAGQLLPPEAAVPVYVRDRVVDPVPSRN